MLGIDENYACYLEELCMTLKPISMRFRETAPISSDIQLALVVYRADQLSTLIEAS